MLKRLVISCFLILLTIGLKAQNDAYDGATVIYSNQFYGGGQMLTAGFGGQLVLGKYSGYNNIKLKSIEILKLKHPKELKLSNNNGDNSRRFVYGKINAFQTVRLGIGRKKIFTDKLRKGAMSLGFVYTFGPSLGLSKPIYVEIGEIGSGPSVSQRYDPDIHEFRDIRGKSSFFKGTFETKIEPGVFAKAAALFEISTEKSGIQQVEVGASLDVFTRRVPIFANSENKQFFINLFISYSLGRKYIKR